MFEPLSTSKDAIDEDRLKALGFKWHQFDRQPDKHWLLWIGGAMLRRVSCTSYEDLGVELAPDMSGSWFCWLRDDSAGRYHRFIHVRHLTTVGELVRLIEGLIGYAFEPRDALGGSLRSPGEAELVRKEHERLDRVMNRERPHWYDIENDDSRGGPLLDHVRAFDEAKKKS